MNIQVLTFQTRRHDPALCRYLSVIDLAVRESPGILSLYWLIRKGDAPAGAVIRWRSVEDMREFRHSELYARIAAHPNIDDFRDDAYGALPSRANVRPESFLPQLASVA